MAGVPIFYIYDDTTREVTNVYGLLPDGTFGNGGTADQAAARALLDTHVGNNVGFVGPYNSEPGLVVRLLWTGDGVALLKRNEAGDDWEQIAAGVGQTLVDEAVTVARDEAGNDIEAFNAVPDGIWSHHGSSPHLRHRMVDPYPIRTATQAWLNSLQKFLRVLRGTGPHFSPEHKVLIDQAIYHSLGAAYWAWHCPLISSAQYAQWLQLSAQGPADVDASNAQIYDRGDPETFLEVAAALSGSPAIVKPFSLVQVWPDSVTVGNRSSANIALQRRNFADAIADDRFYVPGTDMAVTNALLKRGAWITEDINA